MLIADAFLPSPGTALGRQILHLAAHNGYAGPMPKEREPALAQLAGVIAICIGVAIA